MPKRYSLMKVEDDDADNKPVTDKDGDFHKNTSSGSSSSSNSSGSSTSTTITTATTEY